MSPKGRFFLSESLSETHPSRQILHLHSPGPLSRESRPLAARLHHPSDHLPTPRLPGLLEKASSSHCRSFILSGRRWPKTRSPEGLLPLLPLLGGVSPSLRLASVIESWVSVTPQLQALSHREIWEPQPLWEQLGSEWAPRLPVSPV